MTNVVDGRLLQIPGGRAFMPYVHASPEEAGSPSQHALQLINIHNRDF